MVRFNLTGGYGPAIWFQMQNMESTMLELGLRYLCMCIAAICTYLVAVIYVHMSLYLHLVQIQLKIFVTNINNNLQSSSLHLDSFSFEKLQGGLLSISSPSAIILTSEK